MEGREKLNMQRREGKRPEKEKRERRDRKGREGKGRDAHGSNVQEQPDGGGKEANDKHAST